MTRLTSSQIDQAAAILWSNWAASTRIASLPSECRPTSREDGYAIQAAVARTAGQRRIGWKIAATNEAGQKHIGVDGPLAGRLLASRVIPPTTPVELGNSIMRVAEAEFCFRLAKPLPPRSESYLRDEVMEAVASAHPAVETPDSRYEDFARAGAPQLIADTACAYWLTIGAPFPDSWRNADLSGHQVDVAINGVHVRTGNSGAVLGDPRNALVWIANELSHHGIGIEAGEYVTTGTSIVPVPIASGDKLTADYGVLGTLSVAIV
jgi:2-keto-4-pentenoate hydratase